jgi:polyadenylate-binding protein
VAYDPKKLSRRSKVDADEAWLQRYEVERRSIFIGNLPVGDDDLVSKIREVVEEIGDVVNVQVIHKEGRSGK